MQALYRKYRPTKLSDVIGQDQVVQPLEASLKSGKISHAYLFTGPRGCGKTSVARIFAHEVNGFKYQIEDDYVDIIEIDAASNTGVDNIRDLREKAAIAPSKGKYKVYIIDEVHMLSKSAFNALLKTLEEPPKSVIFIMATTDAYKVPVTITSRTQNYTFNLAAPDIMLKHLQKIAKTEKINIEDEALELIVEKGGGSFRDSISLLDQISTIETKKITKKDVIKILGLPEADVVSSLLSAYKQGNVTKITTELKNVLNSGIKPETLAENLINAIIESPEPELLSLLSELPKVSTPFPEAKLLLAFIGQAAASPKFYREVVSATEEISIPHAAKAPSAAKTSSAAEAPSIAKPIPANIDWSTYLKDVKASNLIVGNILEKCTYKQIKNELFLYPERKIHKTILKAENNYKILLKFLPEGFSIIIEDGSENVKKDENLSQISDIMGNIEEVNTNGVPF